MAATLFQWSPAEFWSSGPCELYAAIDAYTKVHKGEDEDWGEFADKMKRAGHT